MKKNIYTLLNIILIGLTTQCFAQTGEVSGKVQDKDNNVVSYVSIGILGTDIRTATDENGRYSLQNIPLGVHTLQVSFSGFETQKIEIVITNTQSKLVKDFVIVEKSFGLDEVVVSGTMEEVSKLDSPVPVEVYSANFFKANPAPSVFESLQNVNGVRPQINCNVCNTGDIHINGLEGPYTMVLLDGTPIVSGLSTVYGLTGIPQSLIDRVEIVKGPASTLYGSEAVGGLINIITKQNDNAPTLSLDVFTTDWAEINTDIGTKISIGKASALLGVNYFNYKNPIDKNNDGFTDVTLQDRVSVFNKWSFERQNKRIFTIAGRYVYEDRWGGQMNWKAPEHRGGEDVYGESIYTSRWEFFGTYQLPTHENLMFQFSLNGHNQNSVYGSDVYNANQKIGFGQLTWRKSLGINNLLLGLAYRYVYYDDETGATETKDGKNKPSNTHLPGVFIQDELSINAQNKLLLGFRYDYNSVHGNIFSPRLNYKWNSKNKNTVIRMSVGNGFRVANVFTEDHAALTGARDVVFANELKPETSWNANLNIVQILYTKGDFFFNLDASLFHTYFTNAIIPDYDTNPNQIIYDNLKGSSVSQGISMNFDMIFPNGINLRLGASYLDVYQKENDMKIRQYLTEEFTATWKASYTISKLGLIIDYTGNLYSPMRLPKLGELDNRPDNSPWFSIQNIQLTKAFNNGLEIYGGVKNLLNFTPASNSIARAFDPFDKQVSFDDDGNALPTANNPNALTFDPSYVFTSNQGIRAFLGLRYIFN